MKFFVKVPNIFKKKYRKMGFSFAFLLLIRIFTPEIVKSLC